MTQKVLKILFILFVLFSVCVNYIYATDINMNLPSNDVIDDFSNVNPDNGNSATDGNSENQAVPENTVNDEVDDVSANPSSSAETLSPAIISTDSEAGLSVTNIINILLITVGIVIILLAIAIIIRLNSNF